MINHYEFKCKFLCRFPRVVFCMWRILFSVLTRDINHKWLIVGLLSAHVECGNSTTARAPRFRSRFARTTTVSTTTEASTTSTPSTSTSTSTSTTEATTTTTTEAPKVWEKVCGEKTGEIYPWIAILEHSDPSKKLKKKTLSKGVLITDQFVLTTVSSVHNSYPFWIVSKVRLGEFVDTRGNRNTSQRVTLSVDDIFLHDRRDIALVKLQKPVNFTRFIRPVCLPNSENYNFREMYFHVCRKTSHLGRLGYAHHTMPVSPLTPQDCSTLFHRKTGEFSEKEEFCAWDERGDSCYGDLGGPLIGIHDGRFQVIGLSSYAHSKKPINDEGLPGIYTRVGAHRAWMNRIISNT
ncbi:CLIP domain-containing serine protease B4-like [Phlebotomus argentipes]|uniref:CLIP domain-containing serine protease B4-like n=1 Tax=Phlebotomus argentipes TaxID=94469 RepID=UPI0028932600|nr:CLIP domain-containing serine protease B4-like [Phlebotomus argentipes]